MRSDFQTNISGDPLKRCIDTYICSVHSKRLYIKETHLKVKLLRLNTTVSSAMGGGANLNYTVVIDQDELQQLASCKKMCIEAVGLVRGCVETRSKLCIVGYLVMLLLL